MKNIWNLSAKTDFYLSLQDAINFHFSRISTSIANFELQKPEKQN